MSFLFSRWGNWGPESLGRFYGDSQPGSRELAFDFATPLFSPVYWTASSGKPLLSTSAQHLLGQFPLISLNHSPLFHQWIFCVNGKNKSIQRHCEVALLSAGHVVSGSWWTRLSRESSHCKMNKPGFECF